MAKTSHVTKVTVAHAISNVFIASINKGQFPLAILGAILIAYCFRVSPEVLAEHGREVINALKAGYFFGYLLGFSSVAGWYLHTKALRRSHHDELDRVTKEKTALQNKQLPGKVKSSKHE